MAIDSSSRKQSRTWLRRTLRFLFLPAAIYCGLALFLAFNQRSLIFVPSRVDAVPDPSDELPGLKVQPVTVPSEDGLSLRGWWITSLRPNRAGGSRPAVLYFCGNGGHRGFRIREFQMLAECGADVLCVDYRGYGDSPGSPTEAGLFADARGIWTFATEELKIPRERIVLFGESLGGGVATNLAARLSVAETPPAALIVRSTFSTLDDAAAHSIPWLPVRLLIVDRFASIDRISEVSCPMLSLHGKLDTIVPWELGKKLFDAAPDRSSNGIPKRMITLPRADHNDVLDTEGAAFRQAVADFLTELFPRSTVTAKTAPMFGPIERTLIYHPVRSDSLAQVPIVHDAQARSIIVPVDKGRLQLNGWHFVREGDSPSTNGSPDHSRLLTLFFPGNGGNRAYRLPEIEVLLAAGTDVVIVDYRGYGDNPGSPSESAIASDVQEVWKFATTELHYAPARIVLYGESLGGGVATRLAAELCRDGTPPAGLILRSTFSRLPDVASEHYPWLPVRLVMGERYPSVDRIAKVTAPILILHGERDGVVRYEHGVQLFEAAPDTSADGTSKQFVALPRSDHNDVLETEPVKFQEAIVSFMQAVEQHAGTRPR